MNSEIFNALRVLRDERGIPVEYMLEKITKAIVTGCKNNYDGNDNVVINLDENTATFEVRLFKTVVEHVEIDGKEISLQNAQKINPNVAIGDEIAIPLETKEFGRIAAQTARNIIRQGLKDGERSLLTNEFQEKCNNIASATIERIDEKTGAFILKIGKIETTLTKMGQIGNENVRENEHIKVYISEVIETEKNPKIMVTRNHPNFIKKLFEQEVPEIADGTVKVMAIAREPGIKTKMAVVSTGKNVDPVGACIGANQARISAVIKEIGGERIDIIEYYDDIKKFIAAALAPAKVSSVEEGENEKEYRVKVPENQLSLAIGSKGQNVRMAAKLTNCRLDIVPADTGISNRL